MKKTLRVLLPICIVSITLVIYWQRAKIGSSSSSTEHSEKQFHAKATSTVSLEEKATRVQEKSKQELWDEIAARARKQAPANIAVDEVFSSMMDQRIALFEYARRLLESTEEEKPRHLFAYFRAFPRSFKTFFQITHSEYRGDVLYPPYVDDLVCSCDYNNPWGAFYPGKGSAPEEPEIAAKKFNISTKWKQVLEARLEKLIQYELVIKKYKENGMLNTMPSGAFDVFKNLRKVIPEEVYYRKILSVSVGAFWDQSDEIVGLQRALWIALHNSLSLFVKILDEYSDDEIAGIFYFMYDGMHPEDKFITLSGCPYTTLANLSTKVAHNFERAKYQHTLWAPSPSCEMHN